MFQWQDTWLLKNYLMHQLIYCYNLLVSETTYLFRLMC